MGLSERDLFQLHLRRGELSAPLASANEAHINDKGCPAGVCTALISYRIMEDKCAGCTLCARACPVDAISGEKKKVHVIDQSLCIQCGVCMEKCPNKFSAVECVSPKIPVPAKEKTEVPA